MDGHVDAISCMAKNPNHLKGIFSGSMDGGTLIVLLKFFALSVSLVNKNAVEKKKETKYMFDE